MIQIIPYKKLKFFLIHELGYTEETSAYAITRLKEADEEVKRAFAVFWRTGSVPSRLIHGVSVRGLMKARHMDAVAAFLAASDMSCKPRLTKWLLTRSFDIRQTSVEDERLLDELALKNHWDLSQASLTEDDSDLTIFLDMRDL